jgi:hypothetical protein
MWNNLHDWIDGVFITSKTTPYVSDVCDGSLTLTTVTPTSDDSLKRHIQNTEIAVDFRHVVMLPH